jgi:hypothetical protein
LFIENLVTSQSTCYEADWERLSARQRATLQAVAYRGATEVYSQTVREEFRLGAASIVQKALQSLDSKDILDLYKGKLFLHRSIICSLDQKKGHQLITPNGVTPNSVKRACCTMKSGGAGREQRRFDPQL